MHGRVEHHISIAGGVNYFTLLLWVAMVPSPDRSYLAIYGLRLFHCCLAGTDLHLLQLGPRPSTGAFRVLFAGSSPLCGGGTALGSIRFGGLVQVH